MLKGVASCHFLILSAVHKEFRLRRECLRGSRQLVHGGDHSARLIQCSRAALRAELGMPALQEPTLGAIGSGVVASVGFRVFLAIQ